MSIFIDGPQQSGKTTLINLIKDSGYSVFKFEFGKYSKMFDIKSKEELKGFQLGKDLAMLALAPRLLDMNLLIDRGPLSTAYYSIVENRLPLNLIRKFLDEVKENSQGRGFVFIVPMNRPKLPNRNKGDGFDKGFSETKEHLRILKDLINNVGLEDRVLFFANDFDNSPEENARALSVALLNKRMEWE